MNDNRQILLDIRNLRVEFSGTGGSFAAVRGIDLCIRRDEAVAIIGESGSGKSATAGAIMGLIHPPHGRILADKLELEGRDLLGLSASQRTRVNGARVGMVFQDALAHLNPVYPVGWQIAEVCRIHGQDRQRAKLRALELLERVGIPSPAARYGSFPHEFSGGQRQRILIAMAVAMRPALLIADEPTTALDVTVQEQILDLLRELRAETGMSLLMITHDLGVAADIADRIFVMRRGLFVEDGSAQDVLTKPQHPYTRELLSARAGSRTAQKDGSRELLFEARGLKLHHVTRVSPLGRPLAVIKAVDGIDFEISAGEIVGVVGESGSGKSSVARMLLGLSQPTEGQIRFCGRDVTGLAGDEAKAFRRSVQAVFQDPYSSLNPRMTIFQVLSEAWKLNPGVLPREAWRDRAVSLLEQVGLSASDLAKYPGQFSGGQLQRIAIARALALKPRVIVCDEAVSALDMSIQAQVVDLLSRLRDETGVAYFFIAHDLTLVEHFADRVLVMQKGRIVEQGSAKRLFTEPQHPYTRALIAASPVPDPVLQAERRRAGRPAAIA